jgi:lipopolysaccharide transport system ATP-binding protein
VASFAVSIQNISKKYRLFNSPKERLLETLHPFKKKYHHEFWALKDINFEIKKGTTVGIIGGNGSGKSTLLQIICSVLKPTSGTVKTNGRISTLLALGAGFNPEFTGRQNVLMNGALMGFSREEMKKRLPEIEAFADIGEFIDQPMKIYSSGMSMRLTFAAAINIDPDLLVVDEVLAVGDAKFQYKCYQKFTEFQNTGKTILFVSHSTDAIVKHCDSAVLLEKGEIVEIGEPKIVTNYYIDLLFTGQISNYQPTPVLAKEDYKGFNIVHYKTKYYAVLQSLGPMDFPHLKEDYLKTLVGEKKYAVGASFEDVKRLVDQIAPQNDISSDQSTDVTSDRPETTELDRFFKEIPIADNCIYRNNYNRNEYRYGDKRAEIIDYLVVSGENFDPVAIHSGDTIDIYLKVKFRRHVELPMFGFSIKTIDGIAVYASNTRFSKTPIVFATMFDVVIFKFSMKMNVHSGDFFIDIGIAEKLPDEDSPIDIRYGIIHLVVQAKDCIFDGFVDFSATFEEVSRTRERMSAKV